MATAAERMKKLRDEERKIEEEAAAKIKAKRDEAAKIMEEAKDEVRTSFRAHLDDAIEAFKGMGMSVVDIASDVASVVSSRLPFGRAPKTTGTGRGGKGVKRVTNTDQPCKICGFKTVPYHDARRHRSQTEKKPFTAKELADMRMKKA